MYQGARTEFCKYGNDRTGRDGIELVYPLGEKPLLFLDRGLVFPGTMMWAHTDGKLTAFQAGLEYYGDKQFTQDEIIGVGFRLPFGLIFESQPAEKGPEIPRNGIVIHDNGKYRLWYGSREAGSPGSVKEWTQESSMATELANMFRYSESDDGVTWHEPLMDHVMVENEKTNIVYGSALVPELGFSGATIFKDPSASSNERYKLMFSGKMPIEEQIEFAKRKGKKVDPTTLSVAAQGSELFGVIYGATSPDGLKWTTLKDPLMMFFTETPESAYYDVESQQYVAYMREWHIMQRRSVAKSATHDFTDWPPPRPVLVPRYSDPLSTDFYTNAHTLYPGHDDIHLFFVSVYDRSTDLRDKVSMAVSLDGDFYDFVPGPPAYSRNNVDWVPGGPADSGEVVLGGQMVPFGVDHIGMIATSYNVPHKWPRTVQWKIDYRWALWEKDRLVALKAPEHGEFVTAGFELENPTIFLNAKTEMSGKIEYELLDNLGEPIPGFLLADSDPIIGNHKEIALSWNGNRNLSDRIGTKIYLRIRMSQGSLFAISSKRLD